MAKQPLKKKEVKTSSFSDFKKTAGFTTNIADKPLEWIEMPKGFIDALHVQIPQGYVSIIAGHSHTGKSTLINHAITSAQRQGLIPVIYDTENNFDFGYAKAMGFEAEPVYENYYDEETGEMKKRVATYDGDFLYFNSTALAERYGGWDYSTGKETSKKRSVPVIEDIVKSMNELLNAQDEGLINQGLLFVWDSVGSIGSFKSYKSDVGNNMFDANAISVAFNTLVNNRIPSSRKVTSKYTNTFLVVNKVWLDSSKNPVGPPSLSLKGGTSLFYGAHGLVILCGGQLTSGTKKLVATSKGVNYNYGIETKLKCLKNQLPAPYTITYEGKVYCTPNGYIATDEIEQYKKEYISEILKELNKSLDGKDSVTENDVTFIEEEVTDVD